MIDRQQRAERVRPFGCREDFVFGVPRIINVRGVELHGRGRELAFEITIAPVRRNVSVGRPINHREGNVEVLGQHQVGQLGRFAMRVSIAAEPAARRHVNPAAQMNLQVHRLLANHHFARLRKVFFAPFGAECVTARRQLDFKWMARERCVHFECVCVDPISHLVGKRSPVRRIRIGKVPRAVPVSNGEAAG